MPHPGRPGKTHADLPAFEGLRYTYPATYQALKNSTLRRAPTLETMLDVPPKDSGFLERSQSVSRAGSRSGSRRRRHRHRRSSRKHEDDEAEEQEEGGLDMSSVNALPDISSAERPQTSSVGSRAVTPAGNRAATATGSNRLEREVARSQPPIEYWFTTCAHMDKPRTPVLLIEEMEREAAKTGFEQKKFPRTVSQHAFSRTTSGGMFSFSIGGGMKG
mmetsp:Transcript_53982/g.96669  ORF Transcript_53982/g.96669 Transcript_53982/m.96669 type:complete len:218 (-) Transcript_53982:25-678(-)